MEKSKAICPECGHDEFDQIAYLTPLSEDFGNERHNVGCWMRCARCKHKIPEDLAERWDGITIEATQQEWDRHYRPEGMDEHGGIKKIKRVLAGIDEEMPATMADYEALIAKLVTADDQQQSVADILQRMQGLAKAYYKVNTFLDKKWPR